MHDQHGRKSHAEAGIADATGAIVPDWAILRAQQAPDCTKRPEQRALPELFGNQKLNSQRPV
jgi:hypothetical protein